MNHTIFTLKKEDLTLTQVKELALLMQNENFEVKGISSPPSDYFEQLLQTQHSKYGDSLWALCLARDRIIGYGNVSWKTEGYDLKSAKAWVYYLQSEKKDEFKREILEKMLHSLPSHINHVRINHSAKKEPNFLEKMGYKAVFNKRRSVLDLKILNTAKIKSKAEEMRKKVSSLGYEIVIFQNGHFSHLDISSFAKLVGDVSESMPLEGLKKKDRRVTEEMIYSTYEKLRKKRNEIVTVIAMKGKMAVGYSEVIIEIFQKDIARQKNTGVSRAERGNKLGLTMKYQLLDYLLSKTTAEFLVASTALSNSFMIRINEELGFKELALERLYEISLEDFR
ncbi:MAG: hypothetical protein ACTSYA_04005 [Candidatus Kariarchaeaceae archaeon]